MRLPALALIATLAFPLSGSDDVVQAAKEQKAKRKTSTTRVITNADVAKAKGKVVDSGKGRNPVEPVPAEGLLEKHRATYLATLAAEEQIAAVGRIIAAIELELAAIERSYFEESDLDRRDSEITRRFTEATERLGRARKDLETLRPQPVPETE